MERLMPSFNISNASEQPIPRGHLVLWEVQVDGPLQCCLCGLYQTRSNTASSTTSGSAMRRIGGGLLLRGMRRPSDWGLFEVVLRRDSIRDCRPK